MSDAEGFVSFLINLIGFLSFKQFLLIFLVIGLQIAAVRYTKKGKDFYKKNYKKMNYGTLGFIICIVIYQFIFGSRAADDE